MFLFISLFFVQIVDPSAPKKNFLKLLSIPITSNPFLQKKFTVSAPTRPAEPEVRDDLGGGIDYDKGPMDYPYVCPGVG